MKEWFTNPLFWIVFLPLLSVAAGAIFAFGQWKGKVDSDRTSFKRFMDARSKPLSGNMEVRKMRDKMFVAVPSIIWILCGIVALFYFSTSLPIKITTSEDSIDIYENLSFHMWILEMVLLTVGISVAVLGFIGYQSIKDEAVKKATEEAVKKATEEAVKKATEEAVKEAVKKATEEARQEVMRWEDNRRGLGPDPGESRPEVQEEPLEEDVS